MRTRDGLATWGTVAALALVSAPAHAQANTPPPASAAEQPATRSMAPAPRAPVVAPERKLNLTSIDGTTTAAGVIDGERVALVIGNASYKTAPLKNPGNDAALMINRLEAASFKTILGGADVTERQMAATIDEFIEVLENQRPAVALVYYAGHAVQIDGVNYLIPVDAEIRDAADVESEGYSVNRLLRKLAEVDPSRDRLNLVFLDACRDNPFPTAGRGQSRGGARGLAPVRPTGDRQFLVAFATAPGEVASDGTHYGVYTESFARHMLTPGAEVSDTLRRVRKDVKDQSGGAQVPWNNASYSARFYFVPAGVEPPEPPPPVGTIAPPVQPPGPADYRPYAYVAGSVGIAAGIAGSIFGLLASDTYSDAESRCETHQGCSDAALNKADTADLQAALSTGAFVLAGVAAAATVTFVVLQPDETRSIIVEGRAGADSVRMDLRARF